MSTATVPSGGSTPLSGAGAAPMGPIPIPGFPLPAFDNTLGALYLGSTLATLLYGVTCLQMFIYITSPRTRGDPKGLKLFVIFVFVRYYHIYRSKHRLMSCSPFPQLADTAHQAMTIAAMYRFLITDFLNPFALASGGAASGEVFTYAQSISSACTVLLIQLFFSWRIWAFSGFALHRNFRAVVTALTVVLAFFSFGSSVDLAIAGFNHRLLTVNTPDFILAYKLSASSRIAFDVFVTVAMTMSLHRSRSGVKRSDHIITLLILFTVNTNLITTLLSITELVTFLTLPKATIYGGIGFISPKTYLNTFLAVLNSRDYMRSKLASSGASNDVISSSELPTSSQAGSKGLGGMRFAALNSSSFIKKKSNKLGMDDSFAEVNNGEIQTQYELSRLDPDVIDIHRPNSRSPV